MLVHFLPLIFLSFSAFASDPYLGALVKTCCDAGEGKLLDCARNLSHNPLATESRGRIAIVTYLTPNIADYGQYVVALNAAYCQAHEYEFRILSPDTGSNYEPSDPRWNKVRILKDALEGWAAHHDYVLWLDADLAILDPSLDLENIISIAPNADLMVCKDPEPAEIFSLVNSGSVLVRNSPGSLAFLARWWGTAAERRSGWDQHVFTRLYMELQQGKQGSRHQQGQVHPASAQTNTREEEEEGEGAGEGLYGSTQIHLLDADALNTRRPANMYHHADCPVLHMVGALNVHRALVFGEAWNNVCSYAAVATVAHEGESSSRRPQLDAPSLPKQLGLNRQRLAAIETDLLASRERRAEGLVNALTQLPSPPAPTSSEQAMTSFGEELRTVLRLGDPLVGRTSDVAMVQQAMKHYYKLLKRCVMSAVGEDAGLFRFSLAQEAVDLAFRLALPPAKPFYQRQLMAEIEPVIALIIKGSAKSLDGRPNSRAVYLEYKRRLFVAHTYNADAGVASQGTKSSTAAQVNPSERRSLQSALESALEVWEMVVESDSLAIAAERGSDGSALLEEGAEVLDNLSVLHCMSGDHDRGLQLAHRGAALREAHWQMGEALSASRDADTDADTDAGGYAALVQPTLEMVPPSVLISLATTYRNMAVCSADGGSKKNALRHYLRAALLRADLVLVHGRDPRREIGDQGSRRPDYDPKLAFDLSASSQRAAEQHSLAAQQRRESEAELATLLKRIELITGVGIGGPAVDGDGDAATLLPALSARVLRLQRKRVAHKRRKSAVKDSGTDSTVLQNSEL